MISREKSDFPHVIWMGLAALALVLLGVWMGTHDGFSPDMSMYSPGQAAQLGMLPTARSWGVVYQLLKHLPILALIWGAATGYGLLLGDVVLRLPRISLRLAAGLGIGMMMFAGWIVAAIGLLNSPVAWAMVGIGVMLAIVCLFLRQRKNDAPLQNLPLSCAAWLVVCPVIGLALVACCCPPGTLWKVEAFGYDVTSYHLQLGKEWMALGQLRGLNYNVYSYFPSLMEGFYLLLGYLMGSMYRAIYLCQMLHFSMALLSAIQLAKLASKWVKPFSANLTGAAMLAIPWTLIVGTMAYNEMAVMLMGTTALLLLFDEALKAKTAVMLSGFCVGLATFAKLTAGPMLALPVTIMVLLKANTQADRRSWHVALLVLVSGLTLTPYFIRNTVQTGNPVFPFAANTLGKGHWTEDLIERFNRGHHNVEPLSQRLDSLGWQWICNQGYAAIGGKKRVRLPGAIEAQNIARFDYEWGLSPWWVLALVGGVTLLFAKSYRKLALVLFGLLAIQLVFWLTATHLQARFLIWTLLPGTLMLGIGFGRFEKPPILRWIHRGAMLCLILLGSSICFNVMMAQTASHLPVWQYVDSLMSEEELTQAKLGDALAGDHLVNHLPPGSKVYFVADTSRMFYVRVKSVYHSAFDQSQLGQWIRQSHGDRHKVTQLLKEHGITHLYVHWSELARLHATYGYDKDVTKASLHKLTQGWQHVFDVPGVMTLYAVP